MAIFATKIVKGHAVIETETIRNLECYVLCSPHGQFSIVPADDPDAAPIAAGYNLTDVRTKADKRLRSSKRVRVAVPFTTSDFKAATAIGRHATTNQVLIVVDDGTVKGRSDRLEVYAASNHQFKPHLSKKALEQRKRLEELKSQIDTRIRRWNGKYHFNVWDAVNTAIKNIDADSDA